MLSGSISSPQGRGSIKHNRRDYSKGKMPKNINSALSCENIIFADESVADAYHRIFDGVLKEYNAKQKRNDRKINNYRSHINNSKNGEKEFYETIFQWGDMDTFKEKPIARQIAKKCLVEFMEGWKERNPNLELIGAYLHMDEKSPHLHIDYIPVATGYKSGMSKRNSLDRAMREMGFGKDNGKTDRKNNATKQWKERERQVLKKICISHGLKVSEEIATPKRESLSPNEYIKVKEKTKLEIYREYQPYIEDCLEKREEAWTLSRNINKSKKELENVNKEVCAAQQILAEIVKEREELLSHPPIIKEINCDYKEIANEQHEILDDLFYKMQIDDELKKECNRKLEPKGHPSFFYRINNVIGDFMEKMNFIIGNTKSFAQKDIKR